MQKYSVSRSLIVVSILAVFVLSSITVFPQSNSARSVSVTIDKSSYSGTETIHVSGTVSPAPKSSGTYVAVSITSPGGSTVDANQFAVASITGSFKGIFTTGGPAYSITGTYTITA